MHKIALEEIDSPFARFLQEALNGEEVVITKDNQPVIKLVSLQKQKTIPQFGSAKGLITMAEDFEAPLEDFKEYM